MIAFGLSLLVTSCAIRQMPGGGPKDTQPPVIVKSYPENYSVNFSSREIRIDFDEYVELKDLNKQLIVSPIMKNEPEAEVKGKSLLIKLPDSLKPNTTYTLNFGNAIVDVHESNVLDNYQYVFATGPQLDSLEVRGSVKSSENLKTEKGIVVMLYSNTNDSMVYSTLPDYFSKTDSAGNFIIRNLKAGTYKLFALKDANSNYYFDSKNEQIAFSNELIQVPDTTLHNLKIFNEPDTAPHVLKAQYASQGKIVIVLTAPAQGVELKNIDGNSLNGTLLTEINRSNDTLFVYNKDSLVDSLHAVVFYNKMPIDTIHVNFRALKGNKGREAALLPAFPVFTNLNGNILEIPDTLILTFSAPVEKINKELIKLVADSTTDVPFSLTIANSNKRSYFIAFNKSENKNYRLLMLPSAVRDIFNQHNDSAIFDFRVREEKEYSTVAVNYSVTEKKYNHIMQILTENDVAVRQMSVQKNGSIRFEYLLPGKYKIRVIDDSNNNGKWDGGNYRKKIQPENVFYYPEIVNARANWNVDLSWILK